MHILIDGIKLSDSPHTGSDIEAIISFYITTDDCITNFDYPPDDSVPRQQIDNQTDGAILMKDT